MEENNEEVKEKVEETQETNETEKIKAELEETTDRYKRLMAEFDNYKKKKCKRKRRAV